MQLYFEASGIEAEKQVPSALKTQSQKSLKQLTDTDKGHFEPKKVTIAARFQFYQRQHQPGETVATFLAELRKMAVSCEFGNALDESLQDLLVCGLANEAHQKHLLSEGELPRDKALLIA